MGWWNDKWDYRRKIRLDGASLVSALTNHPVAILLDPSNFDYSNCLADGSDIRFVDSNGTTKIEHEVESWNVAGASTLWAYIPTISTNDFDHVEMYYGGPQTRLDPEYAGNTAPYSCVGGVIRQLTDELVGWYKLNDTTPILASGLANSINAAFPVTIQVGNATTAVGIHGTGVDFYNGGIGAYGMSTGISDFSWPVAVSTWAKPYSTASHASQTFFTRHPNVLNSGGYALKTHGAATGNQFTWSHETSLFGGAMVTVLSPLAYSSNVWHYILGYTHPNECGIYVDGNLVQSTSVGAPYSPSPSEARRSMIGLQEGGGGFPSFPGVIDDIRIWKIIPSASRVKREYASYYPASLTTVGYDIMPEERRWTEG